MYEYRKKTYKMWQRVREWHRLKTLPLKVSIASLRTSVATLESEKYKLLAERSVLKTELQNRDRIDPKVQAYDVMTIDWKEIGRLKAEGKDIDSQDVLDYLNVERSKVLADLNSRPDEECILIAEAYRLWYLEATRALETRKIKARVERTREFESAKEEIRETEKRVKREKEVEKASIGRRAMTTEEKLLDSMIKLLGNREAALEQISLMQNAAKEVRK